MENPTDTIVITDLQPDVNIDSLIQWFGSVGNIRIDPNTKQCMVALRHGRSPASREAMVTYDNPESAWKAIKSFNGDELCVQPAAQYFGQLFQDKHMGIPNQVHLHDNNAMYHWFNWTRTQHFLHGGRGGRSGGFGAQDGQDGEGHWVNNWYERMPEDDPRGTMGGGGGKGGKDWGAQDGQDGGGAGFNYWDQRAPHDGRRGRWGGGGGGGGGVGGRGGDGGSGCTIS